MNLNDIRARIGEIEAELRAIHTSAGETALTTRQESRWGTLGVELERLRADEADILAAIPEAREHLDDPDRRYDLSERVTELRGLRKPTQKNAAALRTAEISLAALDAAEHDQREASRAMLKNIVARGDTGNILSGDGARSVDDYDRDPLAEPHSAENYRGRRDPWQIGAVREYNRSRADVAAEYRGRALDAVERMPGTSDRVRAAATAMLERNDDPDSKLAQLVLATSSPSYMRAFAKMARGGGNELLEEERVALENASRIQRAMSLTDASGGFLVPMQLDPTLILTSDGSRNDIRQAARQVVATGDKWHGVASTETSWSWDAEGSEVSDDTSTYTQPTIDIHTARGFVPMSYEVLMDGANLTEEVGRQLALGKSTIEAKAFATGTGTGQPQGIVTGLAAVPGSVVAAATNDTFADADVYQLEVEVPARFRVNGSWLAAKAIYQEIRQFGTNDGHTLWERIGAGQPPQLLGYAAREAEAMTNTITAATDNDILIFGDLREAYVIADRVGTTVEMIPHLFGANQRPTGQRGLFAHFRAGAGVVNANAARLLRV